MYVYIILHVNILTSLCRTSIAGRLCNRLSLCRTVCTMYGYIYMYVILYSV